jgi:hypothetical protein
VTKLEQEKSQLASKLRESESSYSLLLEIQKSPEEEPKKDGKQSCPNYGSCRGLGNTNALYQNHRTIKACPQNQARRVLQSI